MKDLSRKNYQDLELYADLKQRCIFEIGLTNRRINRLKKTNTPPEITLKI